jgi:hypothetical protein
MKGHAFVEKPKPTRPEVKVGQIWTSDNDENSDIEILSIEDLSTAFPVHFRWLSYPGVTGNWELDMHDFTLKTDVLSSEAGAYPTVRRTPSWEGLTDAQKADLITAASHARQDAIDVYQPSHGPLNTLPAITEAVVRAFARIQDGCK